MRLDRCDSASACPALCPQTYTDPHGIQQLARLGFVHPQTTRLQLISLSCLLALASQDRRATTTIRLARDRTSLQTQQLAAGLGLSLHQAGPSPLRAKLRASSGSGKLTDALLDSPLLAILVATAQA
jgi:hypothetical protein